MQNGASMAECLKDVSLLEEILGKEGNEFSIHGKLTIFLALFALLAQTSLVAVLFGAYKISIVDGYTIILSHLFIPTKVQSMDSLKDLIVFHQFFFSVQLSAFLFGYLAVIMTYGIARMYKQTPILTGVVFRLPLLRWRLHFACSHDLNHVSWYCDRNGGDETRPHPASRALQEVITETGSGRDPEECLCSQELGRGQDDAAKRNGAGERDETIIIIEKVKKCLIIGKLSGKRQ